MFRVRPRCIPLERAHRGHNGTNGKTTLTAFLVHAFRHSGIESFAVGNIGRSMSGILSGDCNSEAIAVCEVSSFQAELSTQLQADYVLWTNFAEDHLDRHGNMDSYYKIKYSLISNMRGLRSCGSFSI